MIHNCTFPVTHMMLEIYLIIRVIYDVMPNYNIESTCLIWTLMINGLVITGMEWALISILSEDVIGNDKKL